MKCVKCGQEMRLEKINFCPNCGSPVGKIKKQSSFTMVLALVALVILALYMAGIVKL